MRLPYLAVAFLLGACSSSSSPGGSPQGDAGVADAPAIHFDAHPHDAPVTTLDAGHDAGHDAAKADAKPDAPETYPAAHPAMPQAITLGGPVMTAPKFVVITFEGDSLAASIDDFAAKVAASATYWSGTTSEYGVGAIASVIPITVNETPPQTITDAQVQAWITAQLAGTDAGTLDAGAPWPQPDGNTVYMIYYPDNVSISAVGGASCNEFYGYHDDYALTASTFVSYSVVARCPAFPGTSAIDSIASVASHEMIEAVTDPLPTDNPAFATTDSDHTAWTVPAGGELGDLCAGYGNVFYYPSDVPYLVQRTWSNKAAAASHDPCQPDGASPYFNAAAVLTDTVTIDDPTVGTYTTKGIHIPVGGTGTVTLDVYSDAPEPAWDIQAFDLSSLFGGTQQLDVSIDNQSMVTGSNGMQLTMTIKVLQAGAGGGEILWIQSSNADTQPVWLGVVGNN